MIKQDWPFLILLLVIVAVIVALAGCRSSGSNSLLNITPTRSYMARLEEKKKIEFIEAVDQQFKAHVGEVETKIHNTVNDLWGVGAIVLLSQVGLVTVIIVWANKRQLKEIKNGGKT